MKRRTWFVTMIGLSWMMFTASYFVYLFWKATLFGEGQVILDFRHFGELWFEFFLFNGLYIFVVITFVYLTHLLWKKN